MDTLKAFACAAALALSTALTSCGLKTEKIEAAPPVKVEALAVGHATADTEAASRTYSGTVESGEGTDLSFSVAGTIRRMAVRQGQRVSKGQLLAVLKGESLNDANDMAQAGLAEARDAYARLKKLHDANALPEIKWVEAQTKLRQAEKAASIAARAAGDVRITAPYDGIIAQKYADVGQTMAPSVPVLKIVNIGNIMVSIAVPENEIGRFAIGQKATVSIEALGADTITGQLTEKGVDADPLTRAYDVKYSVANPGDRILPGMICTVTPAGTMPSATAADAPAVLPPQSVLLSADNRTFVWLAVNGRARQRFVRQGGLVPQGIVISQGLSQGDTVIVAGMQKVSDGTSVSVAIKQ